MGFAPPYWPGPIDWTPLPRQKGDSPADTLMAQPRMAAIIDANFAKVNTWSGLHTTNLTVIGVTGANLFTLAGGWTGLVGYGMLVGGLRWMAIEAVWNGGDYAAYPRGHIENITLGTIKDARFRDEGYRKATGGTSSGMCSFDIYPSGQVDLATLSYTGQILSAGHYVSFNHCFIVR